MKKLKPKSLICKQCGAENSKYDTFCGPHNIVVGCFECWYCQTENVINLGAVQDYTVVENVND